MLPAAARQEAANALDTGSLWGLSVCFDFMQVLAPFSIKIISMCITISRIYNVLFSNTMQYFAMCIAFE